MKSEIKETLSREVCGGWDKKFLESILSQLENGRALSKKQREILDKVLMRNDENSQIVYDRWTEVYRTEHITEATILAKYYTNTGYWSDVCMQILAGETPSQRSYFKMSNNKYAKKVLEQYRATPKYEVGAYLLPRAAFDSFKHAKFEDDMVWTQQNKVIENFKDRGGFVIGVCDDIRSAANGAKRYKLLPVGETVTFIIEERYLKKASRKKR